MKQVHFLGYTIDEEGIHVDDSEIEVMVNWPTPTRPLHTAGFL